MTVPEFFTLRTTVVFHMIQRKEQLLRFTAAGADGSVGRKNPPPVFNVFGFDLSGTCPAFARKVGVQRGMANLAQPSGFQVAHVDTRSFAMRDTQRFANHSHLGA